MKAKFFVLVLAMIVIAPALAPAMPMQTLAPTMAQGIAQATSAAFWPIYAAKLQQRYIALGRDDPYNAVTIFRIWFYFGPAGAADAWQAWLIAQGAAQANAAAAVQEWIDFRIIP